MNIILPCAGLGTRLGLPYPKELHFISHQTALIDLSFQKLLPYKHLIGSVTVTIAPIKGRLVEYVSRWASDFYIRFCFFNDKYFEWAGSILSAEPDFGEENIVLLPDSFIQEQPDFPLVESYRRLLAHHDVVFAYKQETERERFRSLGALHVAGSEIIGFCDKPQEALERFNSYWCSFGFRKPAGRPLLDLMTRSIRRQPVDLADLSLSVGGFPVESYTDLGVWPNVHDLQTRGAAL